MNIRGCNLLNFNLEEQSMKMLHRTKALAAYDGARITLKSEMPYPSYMMLKEAARGILAYLAEDSLDKEISDKTKLARLLEIIDTEMLTEDQIEAVNMLIEAEGRGLVGILSISIDDLKKIKKSIKKLIITYFKEPV